MNLIEAYIWIDEIKEKYLVKDSNEGQCYEALVLVQKLIKEKVTGYSNNEVELR